MMDYAHAVQYLYSLGNEIHTAKLGLERITALLHALGDPQSACRFVHVAGTNGKGSTSAMIEAGLRAAGVRTGLYTSPHLVEPTERIQIAGRPVTEEQFAAAFDQVHETADRMLREGKLDLHPTYFETVTAMAFLLFRDERADMVVLEVGMGGRLDATNVVQPVLCVITPIDYDHQQFLGDTLPQIASEKFGILKPGVPAVISRQHPEVDELPRPAPAVRTSEFPVSDLHLYARGSRFRALDAEIYCPLAGEHQVENALTAAVALKQLGYGPKGISQTRWPGRLEHISDRPEIILDGAHNVAGTRALVKYMERFYYGRRIWIVYGVMRDKAVGEITSMLFPLAERVIATAPANSRALPPDQIPGDNVEVAQSVPDAISILEREAFPTDVVFITGSLFVVGEARALLVK